MSHPSVAGKRIPAHLAFDARGFNDEMSSSEEHSDYDESVEEEGVVAPPPAKRRAPPAKRAPRPSQGMKSPPKRPAPLTLPDGRVVEFNGPRLARPENVPQSSALSGMFGTGAFYTITAAPTVEIALHMPKKDGGEGKSKSRSGSIDSRVRAHIVERRAKGTPMHVADICGYLLWVPNDGDDLQICRYFHVHSDGAMHVVLGTNGVEKDGPADIKEPQDVLDRAKPAIGAMIAEKRISPTSAPIDCVLAVGLAPDPQSAMLVDGAPMRPVVSTRRLMALAQDAPNKKATNARVPPPERFESAAPPPPTPFMPTPKRKREEEPARLFPDHDPFLPTVFAPACPAAVMARANALVLARANGAHDWSAFACGLVDLAEDALAADKPPVYESISAGVTHLRTAGAADRLVRHANSAAIYAVLVLLPRFLAPANSEVRFLSACGANLLARFEQTLLGYLPEMAAYLRDDAPHPPPETPFYRAYEVVAELAAFCMEE